MLYKKPEVKTYSASDITEVIGPCQNQYTTVTLNTSTGNSNYAFDGRIVFDSNTSTVLSLKTDVEAPVGDAEGDEGNSVRIRSFFSFPISSLFNKTIVSATLRLYQSSTVDGAPYTDLGNVIVDHIDLGESLDNSDYNKTAMTSNIGTLSSSPSEGFKTLDVSTYVNSDVSAGRQGSQFRLKFSPNESNNDNGNDNVAFGTYEEILVPAGSKAQLVVTYRN